MCKGNIIIKMKKRSSFVNTYKNGFNFDTFCILEKSSRQTWHV